MHGHLQVAVARSFVAEQESAAGKDITVEAGDWLLPGVLEEEFDLGYDYTCAHLLTVAAGMIDTGLTKSLNSTTAPPHRSFAAITAYLQHTCTLVLFALCISMAGGGVVATAAAALLQAGHAYNINVVRAC